MRATLIAATIFMSLFDIAAWGAQSAQPQSAFVMVKLIPQQEQNWCWAAGGEMVMQYFGESGAIVRQCAQATFQFAGTPGNDCCSQPASPNCDKGGNVIILCPRYGFKGRQLGPSSALGYAQIEDQITKRKSPWIFSPYCETTGWGHVLVGSGYYWPSQPLFFILVHDPWPVDVGSSYLLPYWEYREGCWWGNGNCTGNPRTIYSEGYDIYDIVPPGDANASIPPRHFPLHSLPLTAPEIEHVVRGDPDPTREAAMAWDVLRGAAETDLAPELGLVRGTAALAHPGDLIQQYDVLLPMLRAWNGETSANSLLLYMPSVLVPLQADGHIRAVLRLRLENNLWRLSAFGNASFSAAWERAHDKGGQFVVMVEGLEVAFAGIRAEGRVRLIPLFSSRSLNLQAGREMSAEEALRGLLQAARSYHGIGSTLRLIEPER